MTYDYPPVPYTKTGPKPDSFHERYEMITESGCWIWMRGLNPAGYGKLKYFGKTVGAHRVSWILHKGKIPDGMFVCHKCDVPSCVNPDHLFLGTPADNMKDRGEKGRTAHGESHYMTKISDKDVLKIRGDQRYLKDISKDYGISLSHVSAIRIGAKRKQIGVN